MTYPTNHALRRSCALLLSLLSLSLAFAQTSGDDQTVIGVAENTPDFSTLLNALDVAGLTETLRGAGPFTIFAPTNEAFAKLSNDELSALLADRDALQRVLSYHVVPESFTTSDFTQGMSRFPTLEGSELPITESGVGDATVTAVNIPASNGVVFAIDTVLTPPDEAAAEDKPAPEDTLYSSSAEAIDRFEVAEVDGSGVSGSVLVADYAEGRAVVTVSLSGTSAGGEHPAALYAGSCNALSGDPLTELEPVSGDTGVGTTVVALSLTELVGSNRALYVTLSPDDPTVVACGEILAH